MRVTNGRITIAACLGLLLAATMNESIANPPGEKPAIEERIETLLGRMTLAEKIGQMSQVNVGDSYVHDYLADAIRAGRVGSILNSVDVDTVNELQRIAVEESRLGVQDGDAHSPRAGCHVEPGRGP